MLLQILAFILTLAGGFLAGYLVGAARERHAAGLRDLARHLTTYAPVDDENTTRIARHIEAEIAISLDVLCLTDPTNT